MCSFARASVPHTSNLTASITGGGRFVRMVENTDSSFSTDEQHRRKEGGFVVFLRPPRTHDGKVRSWDTVRRLQLIDGGMC